MSQHPYDITSPTSILEYARGLSGKSLSQVIDTSGIPENRLHKGNLGTMVETYYFRHTPPNDHNPDFAEAGVELKTTGVIRNKSNNYRIKERLVLNVINYMSLVDENWENSTLLHKSSLILLLFYLYEKEASPINRRFVFEPLLWRFPAPDLKIIERDWRIIQDKVSSGRAHELSEGDTFYLTATRKGSGGPKEALRRQPYAEIGAKQRAFSLKASYMNTVLASHGRLAKTNDQPESNIVKSTDDAEVGIEELTLRKFTGLEGATIEELAEKFEYPAGEKIAKSYLASLALRIIGSKKRSIPEFEKAEIIMKTIRLQANGTPKEAMSFPTFNFEETATQEWEDSVFYEKINQKFLFVVFKYDTSGVLRFHRVMFWNMPYGDRLEAEQVWVRAVDVIRRGDGHMHKLPKSKDSSVAHVRPHAKNKADTLPLPGGGHFTKQCFWLNTQYLRAILSGDND